MNDKKIALLAALRTSLGVIAAACEAAGVSRQTYYLWRRTDEEFRIAADDIVETQVDFVESQFLNRIRCGDTTAMIFYLKTKGKHRGYTEKPLPGEKQPLSLPADKTLPALPPAETPALPAPGADVAKLIRKRKSSIKKLLKDAGKYTQELDVQIDLAGQLLAKVDLLGKEVFSPDHRAVSVEYSREGNERQNVSKVEQLYRDYAAQAQRALRALGMTTESKERKTDGDTLKDFMSEFSDD